MCHNPLHTTLGCYNTGVIKGDLMDWQDIQDSAGEIFDIKWEEQEFLDICNDLLMEGEVDEDAIEEEAHRILDAQEGN